MSQSISKTDLIAGLNKALADFRIAAVVPSTQNPRYEYLTDTTTIEFNYTPTILPPKKFLFPQEETLLEYQKGQVTTKITAEPTVLFGIRPCDLNGFKILNEAFADTHGDPNYLAKLEQTIVIGIDCIKLCDKYAFCYKVGAHNAQGGFDIMLAPYDEHNFAITCATSKGRDFVANYFSTSHVSQAQELFQQAKAANLGSYTPFPNLAEFPTLFAHNHNHPIWEQEGSRCLSCGSCIMVCPTCYCFDVVDELELNLQQGKRLRKWDACMLHAFAEVASGENFRPTATSRLHHRINRKFNYLMRKHGQSVCVGCGRCVRACLAEISPLTIAQAITQEGV